ncbi:exosortase H-associated membrane protein [Halopseudomonas salegens]|uniref:Uncharacterized protein n=1 Tax=Halopseudomonas salegens TaxID=1434072 RepID=A0A1H2HGT3_9GAMM|nr:exosortase H-associated membrane protein [Halopseudomonas salegens]SDU30972.1 hypothetical protein SAMN05216210_3027 [Halopseudomonas salegens]
MSTRDSGIANFFIRILIFLGPALFIWSIARAPLSVPVGEAASWLVHLLFPDWANGVELEGTQLTLVTNLQFMHESGQRAILTPSVEVLNYTYGLPLLVALLIASNAPGLWWKAPLGALILIPFQLWGIAFAWLVAIAIHAQDATQAITGYGPAQQNFFATAYQLGTLIMPTLVPIIVWILFERDFANNLVKAKHSESTSPEAEQ